MPLKEIMMDVYEVVLESFDGGTSDTDDKVLWVVANEAPIVREGVISVDKLSHVSLDDPGIDFVVAT